MEEIKIQPRILPRDIFDFLLMIIILTIMFLIALLPSTLIILVTGSSFLSFLPIIIILFLLLKYSAGHISISTEGIKFHTILGAPRFVDWKDILEIKKATSKDFIIEGLLTPYTFVRETGKSATIKGYYKIIWKSNYFYFPPKNPKEFESSINKYSHLKIG